MSEGVDGGVRVLVGRGDDVAVGSAGAGSEEQAHEKRTREAMKMNGMRVRGEYGKRARLAMLKRVVREGWNYGTSIVRPGIRL